MAVIQGDDNSNSLDAFSLGLSDDQIYGYGGNDYLGGYLGNDILDGGSGDDKLEGWDGNDTLIGGDGADKLFGGKGDDIYNNVDPSDVITEYASEGIDTVSTSFSYTLGANLEKLYLLGAAVTGTGNDLDNTIEGSNADNILYGGAGNDFLGGWFGNDTLDGGYGNDTLFGDGGDDYLNGRAGDDQMFGNTGNDKYFVDSVSDVVTEYDAEGVDTVVSTINYVLGANVENLTLTDAAVKGTGNALSNTVLGTTGNNVLLGQDGDDVINGRGGNDVIVGGNGKDTLYGDVGADQFRFEFQSEGIDLIRDFDRTQGDKIEIIKSSFGATSLSQFSYNSTTGVLSFDVSPTDAIGSVQLATLTNKPAGFSVQTDIVLS